MGPGQTFPPLSILSLRSGNAWEGAREGRCRVRGAPSSQTPHCSQAPTSPDHSDQWGRRDGESLNWREGNDQISSGEARRKAAEGELGRGVRGPTCSGVCWQGGDGVPRRTGEALSARFRIPPCFWVRLLQEARVSVGS